MQTIRIILAGAPADAAVPVTVNGKTVEIPRNKAVPVDPAFAEALRNSGHDVTVVPDGAGAQGAPGPGTENPDRDGPDDSHEKPRQVDKELPPSGGYTPEQRGSAGTPEPTGGEDAFDAEAFIQGTLDEIVPKIESLSPDQRKKVLAAEKDREQPRKGVTEAIEKLDAEKA